MIWSALVLGLAGSVHCLAMCGPIVWTLNQHRQQNLKDQLFYHGGRITTYMIIGALAGSLGMGVKWTGSQQFLSIATGALLITGLFITWRSAHRLSSKGFLWLKMRLGSMLESNSASRLWLGLLNGLLPCGLTYVALAGALSGADVFFGILYMGLFGLGTTPMLGALISGTRLLPANWRSGKHVVTACTFLLGVLLILRGLGLGWPYVSPEFAHTDHDVITVCK